MNSNNNYEKFTKLLSKEVFTLNEVRQFVSNELVVNIVQIASDEKHPQMIKYSVKLIDGDVYYIYVKS